MDFFETNKMLLAIIFLIPGFVCMKTHAACTGAEAPDASKSIVDALAFSCLTYAIASPVIYLSWKHQWLKSDFAPFVLWPSLLFMLPTTLALGWLWLRKRAWLQRLLPHPVGKAWDYVFGGRRCYFVIITLDTGERIGGSYGENSFTSSGVHKEQIYIETVWEIDNAQGFIERREHSCGMLIAHDRIRTIEFIWPENDQTEIACDPARRPPSKEGVAASQ